MNPEKFNPRENIDDRFIDRREKQLGRRIGQTEKIPENIRSYLEICQQTINDRIQQMGPNIDPVERTELGLLNERILKLHGLYLSLDEVEPPEQKAMPLARFERQKDFKEQVGELMLDMRQKFPDLKEPGSGETDSTNFS